MVLGVRTLLTLSEFALRRVVFLVLLLAAPEGGLDVGHIVGRASRSPPVTGMRPLALLLLSELVLAVQGDLKVACHSVIFAGPTA